MSRRFRFPRRRVTGSAVLHQRQPALERRGIAREAVKRLVSCFNTAHFLLSRYYMNIDLCFLQDRANLMNTTSRNCYSFRLSSGANAEVDSEAGMKQLLS